MAIHEPELPTISVHDTDAAVAEGLMGKREREEDQGAMGAAPLGKTPNFMGKSVENEVGCGKPAGFCLRK